MLIVVFALFLYSIPPVLFKCHLLFFSTVLFPNFGLIFVNFSVVLLLFFLSFLAALYCHQSLFFLVSFVFVSCAMFVLSSLVLLCLVVLL